MAFSTCPLLLGISSCGGQSSPFPSPGTKRMLRGRGACGSPVWLSDGFTVASFQITTAIATRIREGSQANTPRVSSQSFNRNRHSHPGPALTQPKPCSYARHASRTAPHTTWPWAPWNGMLSMQAPISGLGAAIPGAAALVPRVPCFPAPLQLSTLAAARLEGRPGPLPESEVGWSLAHACGATTITAASGPSRRR